MMRDAIIAIEFWPRSARAIRAVSRGRAERDRDRERRPFLRASVSAANARDRERDQDVVAPGRERAAAGGVLRVDPHAALDAREDGRACVVRGRARASSRRP